VESEKDQGIVVVGASVDAAELEREVDKDQRVRVEEEDSGRRVGEKCKEDDGDGEEKVVMMPKEEDAALSSSIKRELVVEPPPTTTRRVTRQSVAEAQTQQMNTLPSGAYPVILLDPNQTQPDQQQVEHSNLTKYHIDVVLL